MKNKKGVKMKRIVSHAVKLDHYRASACLFWCFDNRFQSLVGRLMAHYGYKDVDEVKVAGGAKDLLHGNLAVRRYILGQIEVSVRLHRAEEVILMVHHACGAYGRDFDSHDEEIAFYVNELNLVETEVVKFAKTKRLKLKVRKIFASHDGLLELE
ncbi:MAG: hypothetical protein HZA94_02920 [Candidatus Vogelbacteria bacterium]|nr:hypothetical protein [Candidatus Vogelbacteria bacterium]